MTRSLSRARGEMNDDVFRRALQVRVVIHRNVEMERLLLLRPPEPARIRGIRRHTLAAVASMDNQPAIIQ